MASEQLDKRLDSWKQLLLESSWNNMLFNYTKSNMTGIMLIEPPLGELFSRIVINEEALTFQISTDTNASIRKNSMSSGEALFPTMQFKTGDIQTEEEDDQSRKILKNLHAKSKQILEEKGFNVLYLICGFIEWRHPNDPQAQWIKSPLALVPVCLYSEGINSLYILKKYEDEIVVNPYLANLFETEYGISLPSFDGYNKSIDDFLFEMKDLAQVCGWKTSSETGLALLSPAKVKAYRDLLNNRKRIINSSVIKALSGDEYQPEESNHQFELHDGDSLLSKENFPVVKADIDQKAAILYSKKGISFVLQGPPGTGKSQTITNIIAEALADGKKVLFAAEKGTALEAVYKRLMKTGLSDYCLPLYAYNLNKKDILSELASTLKLERVKLSDGVPAISSSDSKELKTEEPSTSNGQGGLNVSNNPWVGIKPLNVDLHMQEEMKQNFTKATSILKSILGIYNEINQENLLKPEFSLNDLPDITGLLNCACVVSDVPSKWFKDYENGSLLTYAKDMMEICNRYNAINTEVMELFDSNILNYDIQKWTVEFSKNLETLKNKPILQLKNASSYIDSLEDFKTGFISLRHSVVAIKKFISEFNETCGLEYKNSIGSIDLIEAFLSLIVTMPKSIEGWFDNDFAKASLELLRKAKAVANEVKEKTNAILENWDKGILEFDFMEILIRYKNGYAGFLKHFNNEYKKDRKSILEFSKYPLKNFDDEATIKLLMELKSISETKEWFNENQVELKNCFGEYYRGLETPWEDIEDWINGILNISLHFNNEVPQKLKAIMTSGDLHENIENISRIVTNLKNEKTMAELLVARYTSIKEYITMEIDEILLFSDEILMLLGCLEDNYQEFCSLLGTNSTLDSTTVINSANLICEWKKAKEEFENNDPLSKERFGEYYDSLNTDWNRLLSVINSVYVFKKNNPSEQFVTAICSKTAIKEKVKVSVNLIEELYKELKNSFDWICSLFERSDYLNDMSIDKLINKLNGCINDLNYLEKLTAYLEAKEESKKQEQNNMISSVIKVEKTILREELGKNRDIMPLRKLFGEIPNLLMLLKPCLMMSPLSVSSFLEAKDFNFDLVIFDEASQILTEDAISAIFRGSQVIISGDSKQLPPADLFSDNSNNLGEQYSFIGEYDFNELMEKSILNEAAKVLPEKVLSTHYRSRYEQLVAFSNRAIYENKLVVPESRKENSEGMGIRYLHVEAGYDQMGGRNCNIPEVKRCVQLVEEHIAKYPERSLGIIAFSNEQKMAIVSAIEELRLNNPQYEAFFDQTNEEPFFVKNIENVQGDERDTIIISLCFAKDQEGRINYGLLSQKGGERFLNVAITRAKCSIDIVGSILPEEIDLSITDSDGIRLLRAYLEFVMKEQEAVQEVVQDEVQEVVHVEVRKEVQDEIKEEVQIEVEEAVQDEVCEEVHLEVKEVVEEVHDEVKEIVQPGVQEAAQEEVQEEVQEVVQLGVHETAQEEVQLEAEEATHDEVQEEVQVEVHEIAQDKVNDVLEDDVRETVQLEVQEEVQDEVQEVAQEQLQVAVEDVVSNVSDHVLLEYDKNSEQVDEENLYNFEYYRQWKKSNTSCVNSNEELAKISENIFEVISIEQPIHIDLLYKRLGCTFPTGRVTENIKKLIDDIIDKEFSDKVKIDADSFISLLPESEIKVRIPAKGDTPRSIEFICKEEVILAMKEIAKKSQDISVEELLTECVRVFGLERRGIKIKAKTEAALEHLIQKGSIEVVDGKVKLLGKVSVD